VTNFILSTFIRLPITITLRESLHWPHRNSNLPEWLKFADYLQKQGEQVLFVRDTWKAREPLERFATCPAASRDLEIRLALYKQAKCNFFIDNGPWHLALVSPAPWVAFINVDPMSGYIPCTPQWWKRNHGVAPGQQFPWSNATQRIVWAPDTFDEMCKAWEDFRQQLAQAA
jgi:ADP-heptose:LPS heptosyltransferase